LEFFWIFHEFSIILDLIDDGLDFINKKRKGLFRAFKIE